MTDKVYFTFVLLILFLITIVIYLAMVFDGKVTNCENKGGVFVKASSGYVCISKDAVL